MPAGDIFYSPYFKFDDGDHDKKLLILLNDTSLANAGYFALVTSQLSEYRLNVYGCHSDGGYYFLQKHCDWFILDTWVLFKIYEFTHTEMAEELSKGNLIYKASLRMDNFRALIKCIKQCPDVMRRRKALLPNY